MVGPGFQTVSTRRSGCDLMEDTTFPLVLQTVAAWVTFLGLVGLTGAVTSLPLLSVSRETGLRVERVVGRLAVGSALLLVLGTVMRLHAQTWSVFGLDEPVTLELMRVVGLESQWGAFWQPQAGIAGLALAATLVWRRWPRLGWSSAALVVLAGWMTLPMTGHAMSFDSSLPWMLQALHGLAAGVWIGTLAGIVLVTPVLIRGLGGHGHVALLVRSFSPLALVAVTAVALSGVVTAVFHLETVDQLWTTTYGRVLLAKVGLFLLTGALGLRNWRWLTPRLGSAYETYGLLRTARAEVLVGFLVLLATALLIHLAMPYVPM